MPLRGRETAACGGVIEFCASTLVIRTRIGYYEPLHTSIAPTPREAESQPMKRLLSIVFLCAASLTFAPAVLADEESDFAGRLYPVMQSVQCNRCHNDNGVASETRLRFPPADAGKEQVAAFGLKLMDLVDHRQPTQSLLLLKPTNRDEHTGGARIKPGSAEEKLLLAWVKYLAGMTDEQVREAREKIARAARLDLAALTVRRLTHSQYNNTVRDLLGDQVQPANNFPKEDYIRGFKNQLEGQGVSPLLAEAYGKAAERLALAAFRGGDQHKLIPGEPASPTDPVCAEKFVRQFGLKAFRRPLTDREVQLYLPHERVYRRRPDCGGGDAAVAAFSVSHRARTRLFRRAV